MTHGGVFGRVFAHGLFSRLLLRRAQFEMFENFLARPAHGGAAELDQFVRAMELEQADLADLHRQRDNRADRPPSRERMMRSCVMLKVLTITEARPGARRPSLVQAASQSIDRAVCSESIMLARLSARPAARALPSAISGRFVQCAAAARAFAADGERDHAIGADGARDIDRNGIDDRAVEQPAPADAAPARIRRAARRRRASLRPVGRSSARFRGPRRSPWRRRRNEHGRSSMRSSPSAASSRARSRSAADQAAAAERDVDEAENAAPGKRAGEDSRARRASRPRSSRRPPRRSRRRRRRPA